MSIRKVKRVALNGARKNLKKTKKSVLKYELSPERDNAIDVRKERELMAQRFYDWQMDLINRGKDFMDRSKDLTEQERAIKLAERLIDALNDLCAIVDDTMKVSVELKASTFDMMYQTITHMANVKGILETSFVNVIGECVCHRPLKAKGIRADAWFKRAFDLECDSCGYKLPASECKVMK